MNREPLYRAALQNDEEAIASRRPARAAAILAAVLAITIAMTFVVRDSFGASKQGRGNYAGSQQRPRPHRAPKNSRELVAGTGNVARFVQAEAQRARRKAAREARARREQQRRAARAAALAAKEDEYLAADESDDDDGHANSGGYSGGSGGSGGT